MIDIVERLRGWVDRFELTTPLHKAMLLEAADEIERLREQVATLQATSGYETAIAQVQIERLREALAKRQGPEGEREEMVAEWLRGRGYVVTREPAAEIERLEEALRRIDDWSRAYPLAVFPEPDLVRAAEVLRANGMTLDAISAFTMRHCVEGVGKIAREALTPPKTTAPETETSAPCTPPDTPASCTP
jgi:hypothetical protein